MNLDKAGNYIMLLVGITGAAFGLYTWVGDRGKEEAKYEQRMMPDAKTTQRVIIHVEDTEEVIDDLKGLLRVGKENSENAQKSRKLRDSIQIEYLKVVEKNSDMIQRNAVSAQQSKKSTDSILKLWGKYNEEN